MVWKSREKTQHNLFGGDGSVRQMYQTSPRVQAHDCAGWVYDGPRTTEATGICAVKYAKLRKNIPILTQSGKQEAIIQGKYSHTEKHPAL